MFLKFQNHISSHFPFLQKAKVLIAVSGGLDSMVLLDLISKTKIEFAVAHCNFQLRNDESNEDEDFVKSFCKENSIQGFFQKFNTKQFAEDEKLSIQVAARKLRYEWFYELLETENFNFVATAHHLDDQLETFLINFSRGTGLDGLCGIPSQNDKIIRPLLIFSRAEIETFANENQLKWREDSSNASDKYVRNKIRHHVVPILKELNLSFLDSFENTIQNLNQAQSLVDDASRIVYRKVVKDVDSQKIINLNELLQLPNYQAYLYQWLMPFGFSAWQDIYDLVEAQSGKQIFSEHFRLVKDRKTLIIEPKSEKISDEYCINKNQSELNFPLKLTFCNVSDITISDSKTIFVDADALKFPLKLRKWQEGDYFYPFGMNGKKKLSKFFKDEKFSIIDKENAWLLCSENQIVWLVGKRLDDRFKVTENTQTIIKIQLV
ncbi:MAG TPA: tRNA lysidine(34) synthetase TilS [Flavobacterium sp.]|uniref:tRNA lysidine(34) synthetase TilS n=1 Tax=unclassified Flavobacterium TaxID=196869 RepID=UPI000E9E5B81|nr:MULTISPECIES: tRNA lysidine(34) synthetase TilS [unclassified Flavobacterium]HBI00251.1 tRNA lysidine(34) synthetase TilS [Flavobacterium sp.]HRE77133.1 tRNA lysidine(34) synthetase TilS [Flavobacterium sp.]